MYVGMIGTRVFMKITVTPLKKVTLELLSYGPGDATSINSICILDELKVEKETWMNERVLLSKKMENLLGDSLLSSIYITILPPFDEKSR